MRRNKIEQIFAVVIENRTDVCYNEKNDEKVCDGKRQGVTVRKGETVWYWRKDYP